MITPDQLAKSGTEHGHQAAFFCFCAQSGIPELKWCFAIPNGFFSSPGQKAKMKAEGLKNGVWDIHLPVSQDYFTDPKNARVIQCCGLWIEIKNQRYRNHKDGGLTPEQIEFRHDNKNNYQFVVCYSWQEARDAVLNYLEHVE